MKHVPTKQNNWQRKNLFTDSYTTRFYQPKSGAIMKILPFLVWCASLPLVACSSCSSVLQLSFDDVSNNVVYDSSLSSNDGTTGGCVQTNLGQRANREMGCAPYLRMNTGFITFSGNHFHRKPLHGVTMATWVKLSSVKGQHSIFCTIGGRQSSHTWGQYHFEVNDGKVRWFHRNEKKIEVFSVNTAAIIHKNIWTHIAGTYDSKTRSAVVYVNGKQVAQNRGSGAPLSQDWAGFAGIGRQGSGYSRILGGYLDEFNMYDCALTSQDIARLYSKCQI